ncbi:MAG: uL15 family ribosomal protein, partial [Duncaniella sp.]|nr:uL15 family ribosomal protein [Duncaniella sp.]
TLVKAGLVNGKQPVKVLANGTLTKKIDVEANAFSAAAEAAITALGGTVTKL